MPLFNDRSNSLARLDETGQQQSVRIIEPQLAEGTDSPDIPSLVRLPSTTASSSLPALSLINTPDAITATAAIPSFSRDPAVTAQVLARQGDVQTGARQSFNTGSRLAREGPSAATSATTGQESISAFAQSIARIESGGRYDAIGPPTRYGTAKGKYQFIDATWRRAAALAGATQYPTATSAPDSVQDAVADAWFASLLRRYDGNYTAVAIAHHAGEGTADRFIRTGSVNTSDVLGTQTSDYAANAVRGAFGR